METSLRVQLMTYTPDPEKVVAAAARLCYSKDDAMSLLDDMTPARVDTLINKLVSIGHYSVMEHASFTFSVEGVSRTLTHQLVRHRLASYSQRSQRYVSEGGFDYIIPPSIAGNEVALHRYKALMFRINECYEELVEFGIPNEDARFVLANACETKIVITMNARELMHFFNERCCNRAQWEIRAMANQMLGLAKEAAPLLFSKAGPKCVALGYCPEGEMSCKKKES